jgi:hypothetical protein
LAKAPFFDEKSAYDYGEGMIFFTNFVGNDMDR